MGFITHGNLLAKKKKIEGQTNYEDRIPRAFTAAG